MSETAGQHELDNLPDRAASIVQAVAAAGGEMRLRDLLVAIDDLTGADLEAALAYVIAAGGLFRDSRKQTLRLWPSPDGPDAATPVRQRKKVRY